MKSPYKIYGIIAVISFGGAIIMLVPFASKPVDTGTVSWFWRISICMAAGMASALAYSVARYRNRSKTKT